MSTPPSPMSANYTSDSCSSSLSSITDPTDFPQKSLQSLDAISRCPICKGFFRTPTIGECGHIYCSFCILKTLAIERSCPVCKKKLSDYQLFKSITTEKIVNCWKKVRKTILQGAKEESRKKRIKDYIRKTNKTSARITSLNPKSKSTNYSNRKNSNKLEYAYLRTPDSTPSLSSYDEKQQPEYVNICIQQ